MAEGKYGRLFTERDLERIVSLLTVEEHRLFVAGALAQVLAGELDTTFPADEPLFLLRAQDKAALGTLSRYFHEAVDAGCSDEHGRGVAYRVREFAVWQDANADRVKVPD